MRLIHLLIAAALVASAAPAHAESPPTKWFQNHNDGAPAFPAGFAAGDVIAARLDLHTFGLLEAIEVLFGGTADPGMHPVTFKVWDDTAGTLEPGAELLSVDDELFSSSNLFQGPRLSGTPVPDRIRVGVVLRGMSTLTVGHDTDGTITPDHNFTFRAGDGWQPSQATGDWILRALVLVGGGGGGGGGSPDGGVGSGGSSCFGVDCPRGQFCDQASRSCTFECQSRDDCGGALCNASGQCVGEGAGCCQTGGGRGGPAAGLALFVLALVLRRRRGR